MNLSAALLVTVGPLLAILVEALNPVSERLIRQSAERDLSVYGTANHELLVEDVTKLTSGAVEVAGLAPTLVAVVTSGFAILHEIANPYVPLLLYLAAVIAMVLVLFQFLFGSSFLEIETTRQPITVAGWAFTPRWTGSKAVSIGIYTLNVLLIVVALAALYFSPAKAGGEEPSKHTSRVSMLLTT